MAVTAIASLIVGAVVYNAVSASIPPTPPQESPYADVSKMLDPLHYLPVVYGETRVGGNVVFYNVTGSSNEYLDIVVAVCEGEIEGFTKVYMDDDAYPLYDGGGSVLSSGVSVTSTNPLYGPLKASGSCVIGNLSFNTNYDYHRQVNIGYGSTNVILYAGIDFSIGATLADTLNNLVTVLNASANPTISLATYTARADGAGIDIEYKTAGTAGNNFYMKLSPKYYRGRNNTFTCQLSGGNSTSYITGYFYNGTDTQVANTQLTSAYPPVGSPGDANYDSGWTSNSKLSGVAYAYFRLLWNADLFTSGIPQFSFVVKGKKVYDPRTSTTAYSNNPAICLRDYLLNTRYGKGLDSTVLDDTYIQNAANACDIIRNGLDVKGNPVTYPSYALGAIVDTSKKVSENVSYFLQAMNATLPFFDGKYYLTVLGAGSSVVSFNHDNIIGKIDVASSTKRTRFNKVTISFSDQQQQYKQGDAPITNTTYLTEDNNQILSTTVTAPYITYYSQARDLAELTMNLSRTNMSINFTSTMEAYKAVTGEIIDVTYDTLGWINKKFRLEKIVSRLDGLCDVSATEHYDSYYSLSTQQEQIPPSVTSLEDPRSVVKPVITDIQCNDSTYLVNSDGTITPRIYVSWNNLDSYPYRFNIYLKKSTETTFTKVGEVTLDDIYEFYIPNVLWETNYDVAVSVTNSAGLTSAYAITSIYVPNPLSGANYTYPKVTGLELIGEGTDQGQGNNTNFTGKDIKLQWRLSSNNVTYEFGSAAAEQLGAIGGVLPFSLTGYKIEVYHPGDINPRQEYIVKDNSFIYSLDKNIEDGNGVPSRTVTFQIYAVGQVAGYGISGESATPATIQVDNAAPALPNNAVFSVGFQTITLTYDRPTIADWSGILVWADTTTGFTPSAANLVYSGVDNKIVLSSLTSGQTYYFKYALTDTFVDPSQKDATGLTISGEYTETTNVAVTSTEIQSLIADKIAAGNLGEAVTLGGVFVADGVQATLNGTGPTLGTYRLDLGPVAHTGATYVVNFYNGYDDADVNYVSQFSIDDVGNAIFGGNLNAAGGTFSGALTAVNGTFTGLAGESGGFIKGGQTAFDTGVGYWLGEDSGTFKLSIGDSSANKITWNGASFSVYGTLNLNGTGVSVTASQINNACATTASTTELNYAHSPNTANKFCLLDGSADVPLAQIPDTLTGKDAELHNGLYVQSGTTTLASTANGAVSAGSNVSLTNITTVYGVLISYSIGPGVSIAAVDSDGYSTFGGDERWAGGSFPSAPSAGNLRFAFYNNTGGTTNCPIKYIIYGT